MSLMDLRKEMEDALLLEMDNCMLLSKAKYLFYLEVEDFKRQHFILKMNYKNTPNNSIGTNTTITTQSPKQQQQQQQGRVLADGEDEGEVGEGALTAKDMIDLASRLYHQYIVPDAVYKLRLKARMIKKIEAAISSHHNINYNNKGKKEDMDEASMAAISKIEKYFTKIQRRLRPMMKKDTMPYFVKTFINAAMEIETLEKNCSLPSFVFEEFAKEFSFGTGSFASEGWEQFESESEAAGGVRCMRKFYEGLPYCCAMCVGVVPAPAVQV